MRSHGVFIPLTLIAYLALAQQPAPPTAERATTPPAAAANPAVDPLALQVLKATTDTLKNAKILSFRAVIQREMLAPSNEMLTFVRRNDVTISRPNRVRINIQGEQQNYEIYFNNGELFIYTPKEKTYAGLGTSTLDLDGMVNKLEENHVLLPMSPLLRSDPYRNLVDGIQSARVIGRTEIDGKMYHHLAFVKADTESQLWVDAGTSPLPRRAEVIYKSQAGRPRMIVDFSDWNLNPDFAPDYFAFRRPSDAKAVPTIDTNEILSPDAFK